jgi:hypothetical protein
MTLHRNTRLLAILASLLWQSASQGQMIDIEDVVLPPVGYMQTMPFVSHGAAFNNNYNSMFGSWAGFAASNQTDLLTPGFLNQYSAYHLPGGGGDNSPQFAIGYWDTFTPTIPTIVLPTGTQPFSVKITNNTYAALSMRDGDSFAKKFGGPSGNDPDFFFVTITGRESLNGPVTGAIDFYLADYRFIDNALDYIVNAWTNVDLTGLGAARVLEFTFTSSDVGPFGINTPTFMALDNLVVTPVPEPNAIMLVTMALVLRSFNRPRAL